MKKLLFTCFLALLCLFQKARIKLMAIKERLGFPSPPPALVFVESLTYLTAGVFHAAQRSAFREAYFKSLVPRTIPIYLTLIGICCTSPSQSQVADSPGTDFPHRSVPNRGGDSRSDTFLTQFEGPEVFPSSSLSTLDGGPILRSLVLSEVEASVFGLPSSSHRTSLRSPVSQLPTSTHWTPDIGHRTPVLQGGSVIGHPTILPSSVSRLPASNKETASLRSSVSIDDTSLDTSVLLLDTHNGLVESDQDMGAGEGTSSFQPAPVPVLSNQAYSDREASLQHSEARSLGSSILNLESRKPSSLQDSTFLFIRFELEGAPTKIPDNLKISLSSQELDFRHDYFLQLQDSLSLSPGEFLEGANGLQLGETKIPLETGFGRLEIKLDSQILIQDLWVQPNDSLRVNINRGTGKLLFLGPQKEKFRLQVQLQDLALAGNKSINPIMLISSKDRILDSPERKAEYQRIEENQSFGWNRKMELLAEDSERLHRARFLLNTTGQNHPVFQELIRYRDDLDPQFYDWLWLYWKGKLRKQALDFMVLTQSSSPEWGQLLLENALEEEELNRVNFLKEYPLEFVEALYVENYLLEIYSGISFIHLTEALPKNLQNQVNAFFLVRQYKDLEAADSLIAGLLDRTESPWIKEYLHDILLANLKGSEFLNEPFWNEQGELVYPESWKGKLVFLDFWLSGCGACLAFARNKFLPLLEEFGTYSDILFVTITGDKDMALWKSTLAQDQLTTPKALNLFAHGVSHPALKQYHIQAFPEQMLLDKDGKILQIGGFPQDLEGWRQLLQSYLNGDFPSIQTLTQSH